MTKVSKLERAKRIVLGPAGSSPSQSLPDDIIRQAHGRLLFLVAMAMICSVIVLIMTASLGAEGGPFGTGQERAGKQVVFVLVLVASGLVFGLLRLWPGRVLEVGLGYFVAMMGLLGAYDATSPWLEHSFAHGVPMVCLVMLAFPMVVPVPPKRYIVAAVIGALLFLVTQFATPAFVDLPAPTPQVLVLVTVPLVAIGVVGYVSARVMYRLGKDLKQARKLGSYQLVAPLGKGGMGEVWRATHGMLARDAAIKLIRQDPSSSNAAQGQEALARFEHEARVVASLRSPHTIQLWDFGLTDDGTQYYAMELLDGLDLDKLVVVHGPVVPERVVHFMLQACHSLAEAHDAGLVHRDIKPGNLFAAKLGRDADVTKLLDFGLATKPVIERLSETRVTLENMILGTPAYMAPEQALANRELDGRADLYALGAVAWWLLTGRDVFQGTSATQVMFAHVHVEPEPPSAHSPFKVPAALDAIVLRCLAKTPEQRYRNADELADALRAVPVEHAWNRARALEWWARVGAGASEVRRGEERVRTPLPETVAGAKPAA